MAQFFYDLSIAANGKWPYFCKGVKPNISISNGIRSIGRGFNTSANKPCFSIDRDDQNIWLSVGMGLTLSDFEVVLSLARNRASTKDYVNVGGGLYLRTKDGTGGSSGDGYYFALGTMSANNYKNGSLYRRGTGGIGGSQTQLVTASNTLLSSLFSYAEALGKVIYLRISVVGQRFRVRAWWQGEVEPSTWTIDFTDTDTGWKSGDIALQINGYEQLHDYLFLSVGTAGDSAPLSYPGGNRVVAGTLLKPDGSPADGYIVRCYHRATGIMLGEVLSNAIGAFNFSLPIPATEKVYCVGVDQLGNTWNAPIKDLIAPVSP